MSSSFKSDVLVACEHQIIRAALCRLLEKRKDLAIAGEAGDGKTAVELAQQLCPDVVLMDIRMRGLSGVEATRRITASACGSTVVILAMERCPSRLEDALRAGAAGCLVKDSAPAELFAAIDAARQGKCYLSPTVAQQLVDALARPPAETASPLSRLTDREREVLKLIAESFATKEIAHELGVSLRTADGYRTSLMRKLGIHKVAGLVRLAIDEGLVGP